MRHFSLLQAGLIVGLLIVGRTAAQADTLQQPEPGKKIKVFILAGQSNMEGRADGTQVSPQDRERLEKVNERVQLAYNGEPIHPLDTVAPSEDIAKIYQRTLIFGPELYFGITLAEQWPDERILLIKRTQGGTSLYGCWNPVWSPEKAKVMDEENEPKLYPVMVDYVKEVLSGYSKDQYELCAMLWVQGETDAQKDIAAAEYGTNLRNLIGSARRDFGDPQLPFLLLQVGNDTTMKQMKQVADEVPGVTLLLQSSDPGSPDFYEKIPNGHYDHEGMKKLGTRFAMTYLKLPQQERAHP